MRSRKYRKFHASKYQFPTRIKTKSEGGQMVGSRAALSHIQQVLGRRLNIAKTDHTRTEWVFCELKGGQDG